MSSVVQVTSHKTEWRWWAVLRMRPSSGFPPSISLILILNTVGTETHRHTRIERESISHINQWSCISVKPVLRCTCRQQMWQFSRSCELWRTHSIFKKVGIYCTSQNLRFQELEFLSCQLIQQMMKIKFIKSINTGYTYVAIHYFCYSKQL